MSVDTLIHTKMETVENNNTAVKLIRLYDPKHPEKTIGYGFLFGNQQEDDNGTND